MCGVCVCPSRIPSWLSGPVRWSVFHIHPVFCSREHTFGRARDAGCVHSPRQPPATLRERSQPRAVSVPLVIVFGYTSTYPHFHTGTTTLDAHYLYAYPEVCPGLNSLRTTARTLISRCCCFALLVTPDSRLPARLPHRLARRLCAMARALRSVSRLGTCLCWSRRRQR